MLHILQVNNKSKRERVCVFIAFAVFFLVCLEVCKEQKAWKRNATKRGKNAELFLKKPDHAYSFWFYQCLSAALAAFSVEFKLWLQLNRTQRTANLK